MPKGEGAENGSYIAMLEPTRGRKGLVEFVLRSIERNAGNICPPLTIGVGVGGTAGRVMTLAKRALLRPLGMLNPDPEVAELEKELLQRINSLGIGPQGFGGRTTALAVNIETFPAHIASMPLAVNLQCHAARHKEAVL